jgi:hypothetical protein
MLAGGRALTRMAASASAARISRKRNANPSQAACACRVAGVRAGFTRPPARSSPTSCRAHGWPSAGRSRSAG